jgi:hypothetical protein
MPTWFEDVLKQSPILGVTLLVIWIAFRHITKRDAEHERALSAARDEHLRSLREGFDRHLASLNAEIGRLQKDKEILQKEKDTLLKMLREAQKNP